jgi:hypothetical protein
LRGRMDKVGLSELRLVCNGNFLYASEILWPQRLVAHKTRGGLMRLARPYSLSVIKYVGCRTYKKTLNNLFAEWRTSSAFSVSYASKQLPVRMWFIPKSPRI